MSSLREAMARVDDVEETAVRGAWSAIGSEAIGRALIETQVDDRDDSEKREAERQAREDEFASWAMEIIVRARQRIGRTKWSSAEGQAKRRIVEALRCLAPDE